MTDTLFAEYEKRRAILFGKLDYRNAVDIKPTVGLFEKTFDFPGSRHLASLYLSLPLGVIYDRLLTT